jgi:hypothetical protein
MIKRKGYIQINPENDKIEYDYYTKEYKDIYNEYNEKINNKQIEIEIEKSRLKSEITRYTNPMPSILISLLIMCFTIILTIFTLIISILEIPLLYKMISLGVFGILFLLTIYIVFIKGISVFMQTDGELIRLQTALNIIENIRDKSENDDRDSNKHNLQQFIDKRKVLDDLITSTATEVAITLMDKNSWVRKLFTKKKK